MDTVDLEVIARYAALAPSVHNTQPWRFVSDGDSLDVRAERNRQLGFLDPTGRQLHVSCGAAVEFAYLAVRDAGRACAVEVFPEPHDLDLIARLQAGQPQPATEMERALAEALVRRYTDRGPYDDREVPPDVIDDIAQRSSELGVWLRSLSREERSAVVLVLGDAEAAEAADPRYAEELARWTTRRRPDEGIPAEALPAWPSDQVSDLPLRDFSGAARHPRPGGRSTDEPPTVERDTVLMLGTRDDEPGAWVAAGRALGWALLRVAAAGLSAQPLGQAIDLAAGRARLRRELDLVGHPQFLLRVGYGTGQPTTQRHIDG
jgi:nitroreductase